MYLYRAITDSGGTVDFYLSITRNAKVAKRFLSKALRSIKSYNHPFSIKRRRLSFFCLAFISKIGPNLMTHRLMVA
ncbi:IS6 family transposase [Vibrio parahaemolyticus]|nr:IS6 family transposase [Vibrio parahaemolyticus]ELB2146924.1 IS6 family transposase [Vibrio parahaemolyticus]ELB2239314.1 IS6 family transposase [Vibrio parahaemolyticus]